MRLAAPFAGSPVRLGVCVPERKGARLVVSRAGGARNAVVARVSSQGVDVPEGSTRAAISPTVLERAPCRDARALLPPDYHVTQAYEPQKVAELSRYWAMPNLRPMKESSDGFLVFLNACSFAILATCAGAVVAHNAALKKETQKSGRVPDVEVADYFGYGFGYGHEYGYRYGFGYGHAFGDDEFTSNRTKVADVSSPTTAASASGEKKWSESPNPVKKSLGKVCIGLKGVWEAIPA